MIVAIAALTSCFMFSFYYSLISISTRKEDTVSKAVPLHRFKVAFFFSAFGFAASSSTDLMVVGVHQLHERTGHLVHLLDPCLLSLKVLKIVSAETKHVLNKCGISNLPGTLKPRCFHPALKYVSRAGKQPIVPRTTFSYKRVCHSLALFFANGRYAARTSSHAARIRGTRSASLSLAPNSSAHTLLKSLTPAGNPQRPNEPCTNNRGGTSYDTFPSLPVINPVGARRDLIRRDCFRFG